MVSVIEIKTLAYYRSHSSVGTSSISYINLKTLVLKIVINFKTKHKKKHTLPKATVVVAISRTKLSPSLPGAAKHIGFVPRVG